MKSILIYCLLLSTPLFLIGNWEVYKSYDGGFRIVTPGAFEQKVNTIETAIGEIEYHTFIHQPADKYADNLVYMVSYCDYPHSSVHSDSTELLTAFFEETIASAVFSVEGELRYSTAISLGDYPGRLWRIDYNKGKAIIKTRAFVVGNRFYTIQAATVKARSLNHSMDKFLDSFRLL